MALRHDVVVVADAGWPLIGHGTIDGDMLAKNIVFADHDTAARFGWIEGARLRREPDRRKRIDDIVRIDGGGAMDPDITDQSCSGTNAHRTDQRAAGAELDVVRELDIPFDRGCRVDRWHVWILSS